MPPEVTEETTTTEPETPLTLEGLQAVLETERQAQSEEFAKVVDSKIEAMRSPDRTAVEEIGIGNTEHPEGEKSDIRTTSEIARGVAVSRVQPQDRIYRQMSEEEQLWRTPFTDHYMAEGIRGQYVKDFGRQKEADDKLEEWTRKAYGRADTLEGAAGASGALSAGTAGPLISRPLEQLVFIALAAVETIGRVAKPFNLTKETHTIPTAGAMTAAMGAEASTGAQGEPTIASVQVASKKATVKAVASLEVLDDADVNLVSAYSQLAGEAIGTLRDAQCWSTGDGSGNNISSKVDGTAFVETTSAALGFVDVVGMVQALPKRYQRNAAWYIANDVIGFLSLVVDANSARQFYSGLGDSAGMISDDPDQVGTLLRRPVFEVPFPDGVIAYGDMRAAYVLATRQGITATSSTDFLFDTQRVMWLWTVRFDGQDLDAVALRRAAGITSATSDAS